MEQKIEALVKKYNYFNVSGNCLYWHTGMTSERIAIADITSIEIKANEAILKSTKGTDFGYHEVVFTDEGARFTEVLNNVVYYGKKVKK
ncbi:MAG: hypothetical protein AB7D24_10985 [Sphaerochaeta sp.]|uniref:hypothetical protein n=1 Tax=Sphaerochaeta sp. TaxID=1972642 RepID=UPI003D0F16A7